MPDPIEGQQEPEPRREPPGPVTEGGGSPAAAGETPSGGAGPGGARRTPSRATGPTGAPGGGPWLAVLVAHEVSREGHAEERMGESRLVPLEEATT